MNMSEIIEASNLKKSLKMMLYHGSVNKYHIKDSKSIYDKDIFVLIYTIPSKYSPLLKLHRLPNWKAIALDCKEDAFHKCKVCNSSQSLNVHHRTYECLGLELWDRSDLIVLCNTCHFLYHDNNRK